MPHHSLRLDPGEFQVTTRELVGSARAHDDARPANSDSGVCPGLAHDAHVFQPQHGPRLTLSRRSWLAGLSGFGLCALSPTRGFAGAMNPISLAELVQTSNHVLVATPRVGDSTWEEIGGSRRIVTYTRLTIDEVLDARNPADSELMVRTLGGQVGPLGQVVHGEAELQRDEVCVLFLKDRRDGTFRVTGLAQGHYPLLSDTEGTRRLSTSPRLSDVFGKDVNSAVAQLRGQAIGNARALISGVRRGK